MSRAAILSNTVADARQVAGFNSADLAGEMDTLVAQAIMSAFADPARLVLDGTGIAPLEREVAQLAFEAIVAGLWPEIVSAYRRGAGTDDTPLPELDDLLDYSAEDLTTLLDGMHLKGVREAIHGRAWALATRTLGQARRVIALAGEPQA